MKNILLYLMLVFIFTSFAMADDYNVFNKDNYDKNLSSDEKILFIIDYSSSMDEFLDSSTKYHSVLNTMEAILSKMSPNTYAGLRIYGHRAGITPYDSCKASSLVVPVMPGSSTKIKKALHKYKPSGMTPITYSLNQAVHNDLQGEGNKRIILLTDGGENCDESPCKWAINYIKNRKDINIDVIAFNVTDKDDIDQLRCAASVTSGKFYNPQTSSELMKSFEKSLNITKDVDAQIIKPFNN